MSKTSKGLGRGIDALFKDFSDIEEVDITNETVTEIPLTELRPNPYQPRKTFDEKALEELSKSIKQSGVFQPIIVRKSTIKGYEIIAGERRFRASKLAGKETVPAIVREFDEARMMQIAVLENLQREDLSPMEEAEAYEMLMKNLKLTQVELAEQLGKSRPYVANYLRLLTLPQVVKDLVQKESLSMGQARTLLALKDPEQIIPLANRVLKEGLTVRQLEQIVADMNDAQGMPTKKAKKAPKAKPYYIKASEDRLMDKFGTSVAIQEKEGKGKIEIEYLSQADLTRILDILEIQLDSDN
ncbi:ParB/RepB/Spo0J family partition protein [Vagococcus hydrophili]|uniref:ParB/RepB/Spo0J family partition protein n=1 Tax=Vagococcus hydrophili TaxID=2714947 RepID=A0A6G8ASU9_9ENTE|nr:ParB/RepB/Spo0J family partition protein [Vagococcus hydrophili]QIL48003.1 ParB/RepB/Spo0J family partition protein [Vagococcus hydrophili]